MKKLILLFFALFFLTGCSANYEIEIYNNQIKEKMEYVSTDTFSWDSEVQYGLSYRDLVLSSYEYPYPIFYNTVVDENDRIKLDGVKYYNNSIISSATHLGQMLEYTDFTLQDFQDSSIVNNCYQYFNIIEEKDNILISTSLKNLCFDQYPLLDNITIHVKTNHKVVSSNASQVNGYHYTWNISRENKDDSAILLTLKKNEYVFNYENEFLKKIMYIGVFIGIIFGISSIIYIYFKRKRKQVNQI